VAKRHYRICHEYVVKADGRFYLVWQAMPGEMRLSGRERALGVSLSATDTASPTDYLRWQLKVASSWQGEEAEQYRQWIKEMIADEKGDDSGSL
jgi:hypothetical protein